MSKEKDIAPAQSSNYLKITLQIVAIAVLALTIVYFLRKYADDISNLQFLSALDILAIAAWSFVSYTAYAYSVYVVLVAVGLKGVTPFRWLNIYFASRLANLFVVQGGNIFRLVVLKKMYNFSYTNSIGVTAFLVWINAVIALFAAILFLVGYGQMSDLAGKSVLQWLVLAILVLLVIPPAAAWAVRPFRRSQTPQLRIFAWFVDMADFFITTVTNSVLLLKVTILSALHFLFFVCVNYYTFRAIGQPVEIAVACIFSTAFVFTRYINVVPGNLGVSELVGGLVAEHMGVGFGNGLLVSGIVRVVEIIVILLVGLIYGKVHMINYLRE